METSFLGNENYEDRLRFLHHELNQPFTTIMLLAEIGASANGLSSYHSQEIYQAALRCRETLLAVEKLVHEMLLKPEIKEVHISEYTQEPL